MSTIFCPNCQTQIQLSPEFSHQKGRCPNCRCAFIIPEIYSDGSVTGEIEILENPNPVEIEVPEVEEEPETSELNVLPCPHCGVQIELDSSMIGERFQCTNCNDYFDVVVQSGGFLTLQETFAPAVEVAPKQTPSASKNKPKPKAPPPVSPTPPKSSTPWGLLCGILVLVVVIGVGGYFGFIAEPATTVSDGNLDSASTVATAPQTMLAAGGPNASKVETTIAPTVLPVETPKYCVPMEIQNGTTLADLKKELEARLDFKKASEISLVEKVAKDTVFQNDLYRYEICRLLAPKRFEFLRDRPEGLAFFNYFFNTPSLMRKVLASADISDANRMVEILFLIAKYDAQAQYKTNPLYESLMAACALTCWGDNYEIYQFYKIFIDHHKRGWLHPSFDLCKTRDMRHIINPRLSNYEDQEYLVRNHYVNGSRWGEICWKCQYTRDNIFGGFIHSSLPHFGNTVYIPWIHVYAQQESTHKIGGVCGSLSYYGSAGARAHGIPSMPGGQPGHCAYMSRQPAEGKWARHFSGEGGPTGNHGALLGLHTFIQQGEYIEDLFQNQAQHELAMAYVFLGNAIRDYIFPAVKPVWDEARVFYANKMRPDFKPEENVPVKTIENPKFECGISGRNDHYMIQWKGSLHCPKEQTFDLTLSGDDFGYLKLDGTVVLSHDKNVNKNKPLQYATTLSPGAHAIEIGHGQISGGRDVSFDIKPKNVQGDRKVEDIYLAALKAQKINYIAFVALGNYYAMIGDMNVSRWNTFADLIAHNLYKYEETAWGLIYRYVVPPIKKDGGNEAVMRLFKREHNVIREVLPGSREKILADQKILDPQYNLLGKDAELMFEIFKLVMEKKYDNKYAFNRIVNWGGDVFLSNKKVSEKYVNFLSDFFATHATSGLGSFLSSAILNAANAEDFSTYIALCELKDKLTPPKLTPIKPKFKSRLLSQKAILRTSSSEHDDPMIHNFVTQEVKEGRFHTKSEDNPWAKVILWGKCEIDGIYLQNVGGQNAHRSLPVRVSVSVDGTTWKKVYEAKEIKYEYFIKLDPAVEGKYIKVERPAGKKEFFHFPKILIYGNQLF